ncbi:tumor necrosis factor ligand superfamily member 15-like [Mercenaria mercenaria]|uniref:tumor necrosis factor ligand superfamily member 15-like n=1 Tax=Mercenaria mercenaria TaxID=6596 RepID=UPI00234E59A4|nr:tumor necrosis factor ligand superfamily member 15-like [Mercenaria mercenaria]
MRFAFKIFIFAVLLCVVVVLGVVLALVLTLPDLPTTVHNDEICLPTEHGSMSCGETTDMLHNYLEKAIAKEYAKVKREDTLRQQKYLNENRVRLMEIYDKYHWEMKPAAKLTGKDQPKPRISDSNAEMIPVRVWRHGRELHDTSGFERYGVRYRNGRLVIPVSGTYFIYSYVDLFEPCDPSSGKPKVDNVSIPVKHGIFKFNILDAGESEVVSSVQPHTISSNRYFNSYSSYVSTLAELKAGDEISVKVSNITYLKYTRDNYFGLNLV